MACLDEAGARVMTSAASRSSLRIAPRNGLWVKVHLGEARPLDPRKWRQAEFQPNEQAYDDVPVKLRDFGTTA